MCPEHPRNPKENSNSWIVVTDLLQWSNNRKSFCFLPEWSYLVLHTKTCVHSIQLYKASKVKNILFRLLLMIFSSINFLSFNRPDIKVFIFIVYVSQKSKMFYYSFMFWYFSQGVMLHSVVLYHLLIFALCLFQGFLSDTYWACSSFIHQFVLQCLDKILMSSFCLKHTLFHNFRTLWTTFWQQFSQTLRTINFSIGINVKNSQLQKCSGISFGVLQGPLN